MKNIYKIFLVLALVLGVSSCVEPELAVDELLDNVDNTGAVLRTLQRPADLVNNTDGTNSIDIEIEVQEGDGSQPSTFTEVRVYVSLFADQDLIEEIAPELLMMSIPASDFYVSENNQLPAYMIMLGTQLILDTFDVEYPVPTFIATRLELELADGRIFTVGDISETVATGAFYASPFLYKTIYINN